MNNRTKIRSVARASILLSILIALSGMAAIVLADNPDICKPNRFSGDVALNGAPAPTGTVINAFIDGDHRGSIVVGSPGEYEGLTVMGSTSDDGKNITFTVCGANAKQNGTWIAWIGPVQILNLTADNIAPAVTNATATPSSIVANGTHESRLNVTVVDGNDIAFVTVNLSAIGGSAVQTMSRVGTTDVYSVTVTAAEGTSADTYCLQVNASDEFENCNTTVCIELTVTGTGRACGDVDTHEGLDARDVSYLAKHVAEIPGYGTLYGDGDVDTHEGLDARDVSYLAKHVAEIPGYETLHC